jgi:tetratricopeptide (TPR) repeat protein
MASLERLWRRQPPEIDEVDRLAVGAEREGRKHFRKGRADMRAGDLKAAATEFDRALAQLPDFADAAAARAELLDMQGASDAARADYERARQLWAAIRPGAPDRNYLFRRPGRFTFEVEAYDLVLRRIKSGILPLIARGNVLLVQGRGVEALESYDRALKAKPNLPEVLALKGEALSAMGRHEEALAAFDAALAAQPKDSEALNGRAIARMALGRVDDANADWGRQLELLPQERAAARAYVALRMADYNAALPEIERALAKEPSEPYWYLYRLTALRRLGKSADPIDVPAGALWPVPLIALHAGRVSDEDVLRQADTAGRRAEAAFQLAVVPSGRDRHAAEKRWREVVQGGVPTLIEYAAARNELARLGK